MSRLHSSFIFFVVTFGLRGTLANKDNIFKVKLEKQHVPVMSDGKQVAVKTAYSGDIHIGGKDSQAFKVVFDTGSGHLFIPSATCEDAACKAHRQYDVNASETAKQINHDGSAPSKTRRDQVSIAYGTGEIRGEFVKDIVCLGAPPAGNVGHAAEEQSQCVRARVITAREMTNEPFLSFKFDGVLGLGLRSLALDPEFHIFEQMAKRQHFNPMFAFYMSSGDEPSEITFGGHDLQRAENPPTFLPVSFPEQGFWRVPIHSVSIGNESYELCADGTCSAIVDTGTSLLGVPQESYNHLIMGTARKMTEALFSKYREVTAGTKRAHFIEAEGTDCRYVDGPPLIFNMGDFEVVLEAADYSRPVPSMVTGFDPDEPNVTHSVCRASLLPIEMPHLGPKVFVWGEPVLKKYYTTYDLEGERVGFAKAVHGSVPKAEDTRINEEAILMLQQGSMVNTHMD